jgi:hypothetical protein
LGLRFSGLTVAWVLGVGGVWLDGGLGFGLGVVVEPCVWVAVGLPWVWVGVWVDVWFAVVWVAVGGVAVGFGVWVDGGVLVSAWVAGVCRGYGLAFGLTVVGFWSRRGGVAVGLPWYGLPWVGLPWVCRGYGLAFGLTVVGFWSRRGGVAVGLPWYGLPWVGLPWYGLPWVLSTVKKIEMRREKRKMKREKKS